MWCAQQMTAVAHASLVVVAHILRLRGPSGQLGISIDGRTRQCVWSLCTLWTRQCVCQDQYARTCLQGPGSVYGRCAQAHVSQPCIQLAGSSELLLLLHADVARCVHAAQVLGMLCMREDRAALQVMAQLLNLPSAAHLCIDRGQHAIATVLWSGTQAQQAFARFAKQVRRDLAPHACAYAAVHTAATVPLLP